MENLSDIMLNQSGLNYTVKAFSLSEFNHKHKISAWGFGVLGFWGFGGGM